MWRIIQNGGLELISSSSSSSSCSSSSRSVMTFWIIIDWNIQTQPTKYLPNWSIISLVSFERPRAKATSHHHSLLIIDSSFRSWTLTPSPDLLFICLLIIFIFPQLPNTNDNTFRLGVFGLACWEMRHWFRRYDPHDYAVVSKISRYFTATSRHISIHFLWWVSRCDKRSIRLVSGFGRWQPKHHGLSCLIVDLNITLIWKVNAQFHCWLLIARFVVMMTNLSTVGVVWLCNPLICLLLNSLTMRRSFLTKPIAQGLDLFRLGFLLNGNIDCNSTHRRFVFCLFFCCVIFFFLPLN